MTGEALGFLMLGGLLLGLLAGFPIAFTLLAVALLFGYMGLGPRVFDLMTLQIFSVMRETVLAAVPLFVFMATVLERARLIERFFLGFLALAGSIRGSLYFAVMVTAILFAAATGIVGASVTLLGVMAGPLMLRAGYDVRLSAGIITAGGTLGILIPPSVMLVVMGPVVGVPVTQLFAGAIVPGLLLGGLYLGYAMLRCFLDPSRGPAIQQANSEAGKGKAVAELMLGSLPVVGLIFGTLGTILLGIATPTDAAALGAFASVLFGIVTRRLDWSGFREAMGKTLEVSSMILFLVAASNFFGAVFGALGSSRLLTQLLLESGLPAMGLVVLAMAVIFLLAWPLEWVPIVVIFLPVLVPVVAKMGMDLLWFSVAVAVNLQTAWLSPPVALSAYFLKGVMPEWSLKDIYLGMLQFMMLQLLGLVAVVAFPDLVLWLPRVLQR